LSVVLATASACQRSEQPAPTTTSSAAPSTASAPASAEPRARRDDPPALASDAPPRSIAGRITSGAGEGVKGAVVYVKNPPPSTKKPDKIVIDQVDKSFVPRVVPVLVGSTVEFRNSDAVLHNVYSRSGVKTFDLGAYTNKEQRSAVMDKPGRVDVFCAMHTNMHAIVMVLETPYFATTDAHGDYVIKDLAPGTYDVAIWSELSELREQKVEVSADKAARLDSNIADEAAK
jgi:plastocyanin